MSGASDPDHAIARAARHGVLHRDELRALIDDDAIDYRVRVGRLHRKYPCVFTVGHRTLTLHGEWLAAVMTCGSAAVLSGADAAVLWGFEETRGERIDVTTPRRSGRTPPRAIRLHRVASLRSDEVTEENRIPVTTVARTIADRARSVRGRKMEALIARADRLELFDLHQLRGVIDAHPRMPGVPALRSLLDALAGVGPADTRSLGEVALLQLCDDFGLPAPKTNVVRCGHRVDAHWSSTTLIAETDGYEFHRTPAAFAADRERDQVLSVAGYTVVRFTKAQLEGRGRSTTATRLAALLRRCGSLQPE